MSYSPMFPRTLRAVAAMTPFLAACAPASLVDVSPPSTLVAPGTVASASGATQLYNATVTKFAQVLGGDPSGGQDGRQNYVVKTGLVTDELMLSGGGSEASDMRTWVATDGSGGYSYTAIHQPRVEARQAREALRLYAPNTPQAWQGRLYAIEASAVLWFAEFYCSGIPMTTVTLGGQPTYTAGFTTEQLFTYAAALFDTAILQGADTARFVSFAKVGKGRALLGLGKFAEAAAAVHDIPTDFVYNTDHDAGSLLSSNANAIGKNPRLFFAKDNEGGNGLVWSVDPRAAIVTTPTLSGAMPYSAKYSKTSAGVLDPTQTVVNNPVRAADGLEARLIEAEADLAAGGANWLAILNALHGACIGTTPCAPVPGLTAGSLPPLSDPGTPDTRLNLLMKERAMWLYLTGHRFADLRRMAHVYHRDPNTLWPTGTYSNPGFPPSIAASGGNGQAYGPAIVMVPPASGTSSEQGNSLYTGCSNYDP